jgi:protein-tyrosine kinase
MQTEIFTQYDKKNKELQSAYSSLVANIHVQGKSRQIKTIAITSYNHRDGRTLLSTELAAFLAMMGRKTLLIDMDLRKAFSEKRHEQPIGSGVYEYISENVNINDLVCKTNIENMFFLSSGRVSKNPMSVLCSEKLDTLIEKSKEEYEYVIFDTPALEEVTDALMISARADAVMLIAKPGHTSIANLIKVQEQLNNANAQIMGIILNKAGKRTAGRKHPAAENYSIKINSQANASTV